MILALSPSTGIHSNHTLPIGLCDSRFALNRLRPLVGSSGLEPPTSRLSGVRSNHLSYEPIFGGDERVRTDDPLLAKQVLSQLSYTPIKSTPSRTLLRAECSYEPSKLNNDYSLRYQTSVC